jgi:hypothetical protein
MADFNPMQALGQVGGLLKKLPVFNRAAQIPVARYAAEAAGNAAFPFLGTATSYAARNPQKVPVRGLASTAAFGGGTALSMLGGLAAETPFGLPLMGAGMAMSAGSDAIGNEAQYRWNQLMGQGGSQSLNGIQTGKYGSTDWNPSANPAAKRGEQQAADRAYQSHVSSMAQQTAQNPLFQKYQVADLTKQYNTAASPAEKQRIGLEIWAQTNPLLAAKLKSGQTGYAEAQAAPGLSNAGGSPLGALPMPTTHFDATSAVSTPMTMDYQQTFGTPIPGVGMVSTTPQVFNPGAVQQPLSEGMIKASYGQQLFSSPDFAKVAKDSAFLRQAYQQQGLK